MATGWIFHELYLWHDTGTYAVFRPASHRARRARRDPATKRRFRNLLEVSGLLDQLRR
jgi:hypothetical protein